MILVLAASDICRFAIPLQFLASGLDVLPSAKIFDFFKQNLHHLTTHTLRFCIRNTSLSAVNLIFGEVSLKLLAMWLLLTKEKYFCAAVTQLLFLVPILFRT